MNDVIVFIVMIGMILVFFRMNTNVRVGKINFRYVFLNYVVLAFFFIIASMFLLFPEIVNEFIVKIGVATPSTLFFLIVVAYLFYASFLEQMQIAKQQEKIEELSILLSIHFKEHDENNNN